MFVLGVDVDEATSGQLDDLSFRLTSSLNMALENDNEEQFNGIWSQLQMVLTAYTKIKLEQALEEYLEDYGDEFVYHQEATVGNGTNYWFTLSIGRFSFSIVMRVTRNAFSEARFDLVSGTRQSFQALQRPFRDCIRIIIQACSKQMFIDTNVLQRNFENMITNL